MSHQLTATPNKYLAPQYREDGGPALSVMDRLFNRLDGIYPHKWRAAFSSEQAITNWRDAWADAFAEDNLSLYEIKTGLSACRSAFAWPPSLPEFLKACRPALDYDTAFHEAVKQARNRRNGGKENWPSPAIFWAWQSAAYDFSSNPYQLVAKRWRTAVDTATEKVRAGTLPSEIPAPMLELPAPGKTKTSPEKAAENLARIRELIQGSPIVVESSNQKSIESAVSHE